MPVSGRPHCLPPSLLVLVCLLLAPLVVGLAFPRQPATIVHVVNGDTVKDLVGESQRHKETVRLIGLMGLRKIS